MSDRRLVGASRAALLRWAGLLLMSAFAAMSAHAAASCRADEVIISSGQDHDPDNEQGRETGRKARFSVEIADDAQERALGLMHRLEMARSHGMLFVYEDPHPVAFWMANTLIPLDMIFLDRRGVITRIHPEAQPLDRNTIPGGDAVFAVLEINAGLAEAMGISVGDVIRHPAFGAAAADACPVE